MAFLTFDVMKNTVNLELFMFKGQEIKLVSRHALFNRRKADSWSAAVDIDRKFISVFLFRNVSELF
jgi:hypothetical protein